MLSSLNRAAKADFDFRLVLERQVQGASAVLHLPSRTVACLRDALAEEAAVDDFPVA